MKRAPAPDLDDLLAEEKGIISRSATPVASPVQKPVSKKPRVEQSPDETLPSANNQPDILFYGTFGSQPMPELKLSDCQNRPLLQTLCTATSEGSIKPQ